jgi:AcrR family transcriptional regulator
MKSEARSYDNSLRAEQASATRERIVDASIAVLAKGPDELSVPAVAAEAGVSVPTVYRHFASKKALVDAVYERYADEIGVRWPDDAPRNLDDLVARVPGVFARHARVPSTLRTVMSGPAGVRARRDNMPDRLAGVDTVIGSLDLDDVDRERMRDVLLVLTSSAVLGAFRDYLGASTEVAADRVAWAIKRLAISSSTTAASNRRRT